MQSMTGFANGKTTINLSSQQQIEINLEIKSVNSRFFEFNFRAPSLFSSFENEIASMAKLTLKRGKVVFSIDIKSGKNDNENPQLNTTLLAQYVDIVEKIKNAAKESFDAKSINWLALPKLINFDSVEMSEENKKSLLTFFHSTLENLKNVRDTEGNKTCVDIKTSLEKIKELSQKVKEMNAIELEELKKNFEQKKKEFFAQTFENDITRQAEERKIHDLEIGMSKIDINEEVVRSKMHQESLEKLVNDNSGNEIAKKIDFTLQEMVRETNTTCAKTVNYEISSRCIDIKYELEKIKEHIQNIV